MQSKSVYPVFAASGGAMAFEWCEPLFWTFELPDGEWYDMEGMSIAEAKAAADQYVLDLDAPEWGWTETRLVCYNGDTLQQVRFIDYTLPEFVPYIDMAREHGTLWNSL